MASTSKSRYRINLLANLLGTAGLGLFMFFITPVMIRTLGDMQYGLFRMAMVSVVAYVALLDLGLGVASRRFFSDALHGQLEAGPDQVLGLCLRLYFYLGLAAVAIAGVCSLWLPAAARVPAEYATQFRWLLVSAGIFVAGLFLQTPLKGIYYAKGRYELLQACNVLLRVLLYTFSLLLFWYFRADLFSVALAAIVSTVVVLLGNWGLARWSYPEIGASFGYRNREVERAMLGFAMDGVLISLAGVILSQTQTFLISRYLDPGMITPFAVAILIPTQLRAIVAAFVSPLFPLAARLRAEGDDEGLRQLVLTGIQRAMLPWAAITAPIAIMAPRFISLWVRPDLSWTAELLWILLIANLGTTVQYTFAYVLMAAGKIRWIGIMQMTTAGLAISLMVASLKGTSWGLHGVAWSTTIPVTLCTGIFVPIYGCRQLKMSPLLVWKQVATTIVLFGLPAAFASWGIQRLFPPQQLWQVLLEIGLVAGLTMLVGGWGLVPASLRQQLMARLGIGEKTPSKRS